MPSILIKPPQIRSTALSLRNHAKAIQSAFNAIENVFAELSPARFEGLSSANIRMRYAQKRESMQTAALKVIFFAENLEKIAEKFEKADESLRNARINSQVLGINTFAVNSNFDTYLIEYQTMKWSEKFRERHELNADIDNITNTISSSRSYEAINTDINSLDEQITRLENDRAAADSKAKNWFNQLIPDLPPRGDQEDGVPWRVRSDNYEDDTAKIDQQLAGLYSQKHQLIDERDNLQSNIDKLNQLDSRKDALNTVISNGIPSDGPTQPNWYKDGFGGCTNYVAEKRNLNPSTNGILDREIAINGNAQQWTQDAVNSGWDVGKQPAKGSMMVFQGEASSKFGTADRDTGGHVAYVEEVKLTEAGVYEVTISEANTLYDKNGNYIPGIHSKVGTRIVEIPADGHKYVDFIYNHP